MLFIYYSCIKIITKPLIPFPVLLLCKKILIEDQKAVGVEFMVGENTKTVRVRKEVAVCGGAVNSPQVGTYFANVY